MNWASPRKWSLPVNVVQFNLCRLWPFRSKRLWVFGAREGTKFDDNSRYMFEYMIREHRDEFRCVWMTNDSSVVKNLQAKGFEAELNSSLKGKWFQLRAGVALYSHGLIDFGMFPLVGGSFCVALWHGMGFKKIYNGKYTGKSLKAKKLLDHVFSWTYRDLTPVTSEFARSWVKEMFTLKDDGIKITGQPRNDAFRNVNKDEILSEIDIPADKRVIIFMPTYRQPQLGDNAMFKVVECLYMSKSLDKYLLVSNSVMVVKLHPLTPHIDLPQRENFMILDYQAVEDNQQLMAIADVLVTDYSSCFVDYGLLERPIIFYTPDEEVFIEHSEKMEPDYFKLAALCKAQTPDELVSKLEHPNMEIVKRTNEIFEDESIKGTCYSENVYNAICKEIELK